MEPKGSLPRSQKPTNCPSPEIDQVQSMLSNPISLSFSIILVFPSIPSPSNWTFPCRFAYRNPSYYSVSSPQGQQTPRTFLLLDFISRIIFGEEHKSCNSSFYNFLQPNFSLDWTILTAMLHEDPQAILYTYGA